MILLTDYAKKHGLKSARVHRMVATGMVVGYKKDNRIYIDESEGVKTIEKAREDGTKVCAKCGERKPYEDFSKRPKYGYQSYCKKCKAKKHVPKKQTGGKPKLDIDDEITRLAKLFDETYDFSILKRINELEIKAEAQERRAVKDAIEYGFKFECKQRNFLM